MRRNFKKLVSCVMSLAMVATTITIAGTETKGEELTTAQMVASMEYNLAKGKTITANPSRQEGSEEALSDGDLASDHAATTFGTKGTYYEIDLGNTYDAAGIDQIVVQYKEYNTGDIPTKGYKIQYSTDSVNFNDVKTVSAADFAAQVTTDNLLEVQDMSGIEGSVRYIRLFYPDSYNYGIQAREIAVLDTDQNAQTVEVERCDNAAGVTVETVDYNTIKYSIAAGENQEDFVYMVYLDGTTKIGHAVVAGEEYIVSGVKAGNHTVKVVSVDNGKMSEGLTSESITVEDISSLISSKMNLSNTKNNSLAAVAEISSIYEGHTMSTAQVALDGNTASGEGATTALRTGSGAPQYVIIDLGDYYIAEEMDKILLAHTNANTYPATVKVEFSLDGNTYTAVGSGTGYKYSSETPINSITLDSTAEYNQEAVRYVKLTLSEGVSNWGYVLNEIAVVANTEEPTIKGSDIPEASDVIIDASSLETIKYTIVAGENQTDATYVVKLGNQIINNAAKADTEYTLYDLPAGTYTLKVCTLEDGWQSKGISKETVIDGYVNYINKSLNIANSKLHPNVVATAVNDNYGENYLTGSQDISASIGAVNNGITYDHAHHTGYVQSRPDTSEFYINYDFSKDYKPEEIHSIIALYESTNNAATEYEILFSGDGENFEQLVYVKDAKFETQSSNGATNAMLYDVIDFSNYTQETVRYIQYHVIDGNYGEHYKDDGSINWGSSGYHLCELAVMGKESLLPEKATGVVATSPEYNKLVINWVDTAEADVEYKVYIDGSPLGFNILPGVQTAEFTIRAGSYNIQVATIKNEFITLSEEYTVKVEEETTTPAPTTTTVTQKPTTPNATSNNQVTVSPTTPAPVTSVTAPGVTKIKKAKVGKKKVSVKLRKVNDATGYEVTVYRTKKNAKKDVKALQRVKTVNVKVVIKKLKKGKKYYFRARAYKEINGVITYGEWSKVKASKKVK